MLEVEQTSAVCSEGADLLFGFYQILVDTKLWIFSHKV